MSDAIMNEHSALVILLAGVAFFMHGMSLASESLQKLMSNKLRELFSKVSKNKFITFGVGIFLTICLQSSGAVTSMLVGLGSAGVVKLRQVMAVILGAAVGTTLTVQLISFNISKFGLGMFAVSFSFYFLAKKRIVKELLAVVMGFGLIFFGLEVVGIASKMVQQFESITQIFIYLNEYPLVALFVSMVFTGLVHSSAVTIGFAMTLAASGLISLSDSMYWMLGANIGTTSTALMASLGGNYVGRQVAWAHFFYKLVSVLLFVVLIDPFVQLVELFPGGAQRDIANAHTVFNIVAALLFFPLIDLGAKWIKKMFPPKDSEVEFSTEFLREDDYRSSTLALAYARRELLRMGDIVISMVKDSIELFKQNDPELMADISQRDNQVDLLHREIKLFLVSHSDEGKGRVSKEIFELISLANDLESAADVIDNNIKELARKKQSLKLDFSPLGWNEIKQLHDLVVKISAMSMTAFQMQDKKLAGEIVQFKRDIRKVERKLRESHIERLNQGLKESINTSSIHLDVLGDYRRVVGLMANYSYVIPKKTAEMD